MPLLVVAPHGLWSSLAGQAERPLQLESLGSSALLVAHQAFGVDLTVVFSHGSNNLGGHGADLIATGQTLLGAVVLVALWVAYGRGPQTPERLLRYSAACVCAFVAFGKVLSPQYLIWLIALVLIVPGRRGDISAVILAVAMLVTQLWFPSHYISLAYHLDPRASWLVFGRDVILVGLLLTLAWPDGRAGRLRTGTVSLVAAIVGLALVGAAASTSVQSGNIRTALLNETGVASTCESVKPVPTVTSGSAVYETVTQPNNARRSRCLWVDVRSTDGGQLFAAAYAPKFVTADPQTNYLGDTGICTNIRGVTGPVGGISVRVPAHTPLVVDVEACSSDELDLHYTLDLRTTARPVAGFLAASAVRTGNGLQFRWRVAREPARRPVRDSPPVRGNDDPGRARPRRELEPPLVPVARRERRLRSAVFPHRADAGWKLGVARAALARRAGLATTRLRPALRSESRNSSSCDHTRHTSAVGTSSGLWPTSVLRPQAARVLGRARGAAEQGAVLAGRLPVPKAWMVVGALLIGEWVANYRAAMIAAHNGWQFYNGGDGSWYYTTTTVLAHGHIPQATLGFGYSLVLAPIVHFAGPNAMLGLPMIVVFNQLVLVPIALVCVYAIANMIGGRWFAFFVGAVWVVFPLAAIHYFLPDYHERYVDMQMPQMIGLSGEGDYPSMVLLLVSAYFVLRFVRFGRRLDVVTSGLAAGFAIAVEAVQSALPAGTVPRAPRGAKSQGARPLRRRDVAVGDRADGLEVPRARLPARLSALGDRRGSGPAPGAGGQPDKLVV